VPANLIDAALAAYARAIRILDPIRFQVWAERDITMPQVRVLFMLAESGDQSAGDIADALGVAAWRRRP
jgi:DNA-binding MarR family transcriptional regulator